jgi:hypothetical protein
MSFPSVSTSNDRHSSSRLGKVVLLNVIPRDDDLQAPFAGVLRISRKSDLCGGCTAGRPTTLRRGVALTDDGRRCGDAGRPAQRSSTFSGLGR